MKRPDYMEELLKIVFLWLGIAFSGMALLCFAGVLRPAKNSLIQSLDLLGYFYVLTGVVFILLQTVLGRIARYRRRLHRELLEHGTKISGTVERVYLQAYTKYGGESPYRISYAYTWQGKACRRKSRLLWENPGVAEGDPIAVYADDAGRATVRL